VVNPALHNGTKCVHTGGSANLVARIIATRHRSIGNVSQPISNCGAIALTD
jgi:hypothetical protein